MATIEDIKLATNKFFELHWASQELGDQPQWSDEYNLVGTIPNNELPGCYCLMVNTKVVYIGSSVRKSDGTYEHSGIGARSNDYLQWDKSTTRGSEKTRYTPRPPHSDVTSMYTIGFPTQNSHMAVALEAFLLRQFRDAGLRNIRG
jgi:hypothetical protein